MQSSAGVQLRDVSRSFATEAEVVWAVRDANLFAKPGELVCIYGPSGSGKTTLLNIIAGLDVADSGDVQTAGHRLGELDEEARAHVRLKEVGVVFQDTALIEEFNAAENVALPLEAAGVAAHVALAQAEGLLGRVDMGGMGARFPRQLSGGQRQRVGIARALGGDRSVLVMDEPTGSLDTKASVSLFELMRDLCEAGTLSIVCSHDPLCREYAHVVYEMIDGQLRWVSG